MRAQGYDPAMYYASYYGQAGAAGYADPSMAAAAMPQPDPKTGYVDPYASPFMDPYASCFVFFC